MIKKKLLFILFFQGMTINCNTEGDWYQRDIPYELELFEQSRFTSPVTFFYDGMITIIHQLQNLIFSSSAALYNGLLSPHAYSGIQAQVRPALASQLCNQEEQFIKLRLPSIKRQLESIFNINLKDDAIPRIACCFSGGGFRAMIMTLGFLSGAQDSGLLDSTLYLAGLSGSTWAIAPWIASGKTLNEVQIKISYNVASGIQHLTHPNDLHQLLDIIKTKILHNQIVSVVDIYGCLLAKTLLTDLIDNPYQATISQTHAKRMDGTFPMPIYTTIQTTPRPYEWTEVTPFETGSAHLQGFVPTWSFGRKFKQGSSQDYAPEQTLGYFMGIFGSAFEVSFKDVIAMTASNLTKIKEEMPEVIAAPLHQILKLILDTALADIRLFPAVLANYSYKLNYSPEKNKKMLEYVDAGIDFNLALVPLLRSDRQIDIIIIYDASASVNGAPELKRAQSYAKRKGLKFPPINYENIDKNQISVFKDTNDPSVPVIIYMPRIKNEQYNATFDLDECVATDFCNTFNFEYSWQQFHLLAGLPSFTLKQYDSTIKTVIKEILISKYGYEIS